MPTTGLISIVNNDNVLFKIMSECNGRRMKKTIEKLKKFLGRKKNVPGVEDLFWSVQGEFGCLDCLMIQSKFDQYKAKNTPTKSDEHFASTFSDPKFNPLSNDGSSDYLEIIDIKDIPPIIDVEEVEVP